MINTKKGCECIGEQLSGYIDGELTQQEAQQVLVHLNQCEQCSKTYQNLIALKTAVGDATYPDMEDEKMKAVLDDLTSRRLFDLAWFLFISGVLMVVVFSIYYFWVDHTMSVFSKLGLSLIWGGGIGLFLTVLRQRLQISKTDKYNKVEL